MAKLKIVRLTDLPEDQVNQFIGDFALDGYELRQKFRQPNGLWTIEVAKKSAGGAPNGGNGGSAVGAGSTSPGVPAAPAGPIASGSETDALILARTIFGEAAGEPAIGKEGVANVVLNRMRSGRYPTSPGAVCLQPKQFSCWNAGDPNLSKIKNLDPGENSTFDICYNIADRAVHDLLHDNTGGATHYYADYIPPPYWVINSPNARLTARIGRHLFYSGIA